MDDFPNGVSSFGMALTAGGLPGTTGKYIFVNPSGSDGNDGLGVSGAVKTVQHALDLATTNKDDVIVLSTYADHNLTKMLNITKNRVHFVSFDVFGRLYGQRAKIVLPVLTTALAANVFAVKNIGVGNTFNGIKIVNNNTEAATLAALGEGGEYACYRNCEIYNSTTMNSDATADMYLNTDSAQFFNCTFGSVATAVVGDKIRPCINMTSGLVSSAVSGGVSRDVYFQGCKFWRLAGGTTTVHILIASTNDLERLMEIKDCTFVAAKLGSTPAVAISSPTLTKAQILLTGDTVAVNCTKIGTATGIINCTPARSAGTIVGIQANG